MVFTRMTIFKVSPSYLESNLGSQREIIGGMIEVSRTFLGILARARNKWANVNNLYIAVFCFIIWLISGIVTVLLLYEAQNSMTLVKSHVKLICEWFCGHWNPTEEISYSIAMVILCWKKIFNFRDAIHIKNILRSFKRDIEFPSAANFSVKIR